MHNSYKLRANFVLFPILALAFAALAGVAQAATFTVNSTADVVDANPGDGICSTGATLPGTPGTLECTLRAAVAESNALSGANTIVLPAANYLLNHLAPCIYRPIGRTDFVTVNLTTLCITTPVTISGAGSTTTIIDGGSLDRVIFVSRDGTVGIRGVTIQNGKQQGGTGDFGGGGGGVHNQGSLAVTDSVITLNRSTSADPGIYNRGMLTLSGTTVSNNTSPQGGAITNDGGGAIAIINSTISGNITGNGAGVFNFNGTAAISGTTITNNTASSSGGGVFNGFGTMTVTNTTISGNSSASSGGGLFNGGTVNMNNVTIAQNKGQNGGGGIYNGKSIILKNTLIFGNSAGNNLGPDCLALPDAALVSQGHNLLGNPQDCSFTGDTTGNITGKDPLLGILANNGGPTQTHAFVGSPALNAGDPAPPGAGGTACALADQRGFFRPQATTCDIGAFERNRSFSLSAVIPAHGGNTGSAAAIISGGGFVDGAAVKLRRTGQPDIAGATATVDGGGSALSTSFNLNGSATGAWDVVVTNPDNSSLTLAAAFTVEPAQAPQVWTQLVGQSAIRVGSPAAFHILYGNRGNVEATGVPVTLSLPGIFSLNVFFQITPPPPQPGQVPTDWSLVPVYVLPGPQNGVTNVVLFLPSIPAGFALSLIHI